MVTMVIIVVRYADSVLVGDVNKVMELVCRDVLQDILALSVHRRKALGLVSEYSLYRLFLFEA